MVEYQHARFKKRARCRQETFDTPRGLLRADLANGDPRVLTNVTRPPVGVGACGSGSLPRHGVYRVLSQESGGKWVNAQRREDFANPTAGVVRTATMAHVQMPHGDTLATAMSQYWIFLHMGARWRKFFVAPPLICITNPHPHLVNCHHGSFQHTETPYQSPRHRHGRC